MKEFEEFRKNSVLNVQVQQLQEKNSVLEEDNCRIRSERRELMGRLEREVCVCVCVCVCLHEHVCIYMCTYTFLKGQYHIVLNYDRESTV